MRLNPDGEFVAHVLDIVDSIPSGRVMTYGDVAVGHHPARGDRVDDVQHVGDELAVRIEAHGAGASELERADGLAELGLADIREPDVVEELLRAAFARLPDHRDARETARASR